MIRILHVVHTMECGGIETLLMNVYRNIDRNQIQFDFLVNGSNENYYTNEILSLGGRVLSVTPKRVSLKRNLQDTVSVMKEGHYEIVHIHQDSMIAFAIWCAKKAGIYTIFTHAHTTSANGWYRKVLAQIARGYIIRNATEKFACSSAAARWIYGANVTDFILFKNAIDAKKFQYKYVYYHNSRLKFGIEDDQFVIGTCGRLSVEKNQIFLVEIFAEIKRVKDNAKLILIGDGDEREHIYDRAVELGVIDDISFTGMVSNISYYYSMLDCFVLPSLFEGLPLAGVEAQAAGIPSFFSMGVTKEIKLIDNVYFLELDQGATAWATEIIDKVDEKKDTLKEIRSAGYDIEENAKFLQKKYLEYSWNQH